MPPISFYVLVISIFVLSNFCDAVVLNIFDPNYNCSPEGAEVQRANVYFRCRNQRLAAAGCLGLDNVRVPINETYKAFGSYDMLCKSVSTYWAQFIPLTCWMHNRQYAPGEIYVQGQFWYTCVKSNDELRSVISGCVGENGEQIIPGGMFKMKNYIFTCARLGNTGMNMEPTACIHNDKQYKVGQEMVDTNFIYKCVRKNGVILTEQTGCVLGGRKVDINEKFIQNDYVWQCQKNGQIISQSIIGCVGKNNMTYNIDQKWTEEKAPLRYVVRCTKQTNGLVKEYLQCAYDHPDGRAVLNPGCMRRVGSMLVVCYSPGANSIGYRLNSIAETMIEQRMAAAGFKLC